MAVAVTCSVTAIVAMASTAAAMRHRDATRAREFAVAHSERIVATPIHAWQPLPEEPRQPGVPARTIDDLMFERLELEREASRGAITPELLRLEANYIRTNGSKGDVVLFETSFHLEPRYLSLSPAGRDTTISKTQSGTHAVMYFLGSARTPLALPIVSNLSNALKGDEASYTVHLGVLPLPRSAGMDTSILRYYVIIERAIESNRSASEKKFERFAKEFTVKANEPIQLRLENTPPDRQLYILKLEDNSVLNFYEDFARYFSEHILLSGERLAYGLGRAELSAISSRLSIPYTVGQASRVRVELLSIVDSANTRSIVDTVMRPADYLAELDMKPFANGPYQYRFTARDIATNKVLYSQTASFEKKSPLLFESGTRIAPPDTLEVGGKRVDAMAMLERMNNALMVEKARTERLDATVRDLNDQNVDLKKTLETTKRNTIAGLRMRSGVGFGHSSGTAFFVGVESTLPSLSLDLSFGMLYASVPYLSYTTPPNVTKIFDSPRSLGLQLSYIPVKLFDGLLEPVGSLGYYGIWSNSAAAGGLRSATLLTPSIGLATEPFGENSAFGASLQIGSAIGLGVGAPSELDVSARCYLRF